MSIPKYEELIPAQKDSEAIDQLRHLAREKGYELLVLLNEKASNNNWKNLQVATSESLTCGLIMSTLVDIPWGGYLKYGGFGVYDTDAKRVFNRVTIDDVYTHKCAGEMAVGVLKNSNATIAIAVTGNAMPLNEHVKMLGEVFIGIAGYNDNNEIIYITKVINACKDSINETMKETCKTWYDTINWSDKKEYNNRITTSGVSQEIRYYTAYEAYKLCIEFIEKFDPKVPDEIINRKNENAIIAQGPLKIHNSVPDNKYEFGGDGQCMNESMFITEKEQYCDKQGLRMTHVYEYSDKIPFNLKRSSAAKLTPDSTKDLNVESDQSDSVTQVSTGNKKSGILSTIFGIKTTGGIKCKSKRKQNKCKKTRKNKLKNM